jgi:hypothetical protein
LVQGQANRGDDVTGLIPGIGEEDREEAKINEQRLKGG